MEPSAIRACLVTLDPSLVTVFMEECDERGIEARAVASERFSEELAQAKYEAVLIDFDLMPNPLEMLGAVRHSAANRNAVILAVATEAGHGQQALASGANVLLRRPLDGKEIRRVLDGSYEGMVRERRRYFRCAADIPALVIRSRSGEEFKCTTMNVSSSGVGLRTPVPLDPGEEVQLVIFLRQSDTMVRAFGTVIWDDKHGKSGISFRCTSAQHQIELDAWLDTQFGVSVGGDEEIKRVSL